LGLFEITNVPINLVIMAEENEIIGSASEFIKGEFESQLLSFGCCLEFDDRTSLDRAVKCQMAISLSVYINQTLL
jgi:hypothetical protein